MTAINIPTELSEFQNNFKALSVKPEMIIVKKDKKTNPNEVQAITGATISSKAVVKLLNNTINRWDEPIATYLEENNLKALGAND